MSGVALATTVGSKNWPEPRVFRRWPPPPPCRPWPGRRPGGAAPFQRGFLDQRALVHAVFKAVADLGGLHLGGELGHELVVHAFLHIKAVAHTQVWPALRYLLAKAPSTALSTSASSNTMNGALPPSSSDIFLTVGRLRHQDAAHLGAAGEADVAHHVACAQHLADGDGVHAVGVRMLSTPPECPRGWPARLRPGR